MSQTGNERNWVLRTEEDHQDTKRGGNSLLFSESWLFWQQKEGSDDQWFPGSLPLYIKGFVACAGQTTKVLSVCTIGHWA